MSKVKVKYSANDLCKDKTKPTLQKAIEKGREAAAKRCSNCLFTRTFSRHFYFCDVED